MRKERRLMERKVRDSPLTDSFVCSQSLWRRARAHTHTHTHTHIYKSTSSAFSTTPAVAQCPQAFTYFVLCTETETSPLNRSQTCCLSTTRVHTEGIPNCFSPRQPYFWATLDHRPLFLSLFTVPPEPFQRTLGWDPRHHWPTMHPRFKHCIHCDHSVQQESPFHPKPYMNYISELTTTDKILFKCSPHVVLSQHDHKEHSQYSETWGRSNYSVALLNFSKSAEVNRKNEGVEAFVKMLTPVPILGEPADICSFASANTTDIIIIILTIIMPSSPPTRCCVSCLPRGVVSRSFLAHSGGKIKMPQERVKE